MSGPPRYFVTATDTGVGKTQVACALLRLMARAGLRPFAFKPYESGVTARTGPADAAALRTAAGAWQPLRDVNFARLAAPLAPAIAARALSAAGRRRHQAVWPRVVRQLTRWASAPGVVEGAGGVLVPLDERHDVLDLIEISRLPVVLAARAGLGTLNHTRLTLQALTARGVPVAAVVLVQGQPRADASQASNPAELRRLQPGLRVLGPVPFHRGERARATAFERVLAPLVR